MQTLCKILLVIAASIAIFTAIAHIACIPIGAKCYQAQLAPEIVVESAKAGTWLAPSGTLVVASIFLIWAAYALSGAAFIRRLPLLTLGNYTIAFLCIARGLLGIQLWLRYPEAVSTFASVANWLWFLTGCCFAVGYYGIKKVNR